MPTFTRLASAILFAIAAIYLGEQYKLLYETPQRLGHLTLLLGVVGTYAGWSFVGGRIQGKVVNDIFHCVQGVIVALSLALASFGLMEVFELGYKMRYSSISEAFVGFFDLTGAHVIRMMDVGFLSLMAAIITAIGIALSLIYRWAERARFA